ncbi:hypothetical protein GCM10010304_83650 [Streptomyces roseoviolaceus]
MPSSETPAHRAVNPFTARTVVAVTPISPPSSARLGRAQSYVSFNVAAIGPRSTVCGCYLTVTHLCGAYGQGKAYMALTSDN